MYHKMEDNAPQNAGLFCSVFMEIHWCFGWSNCEVLIFNIISLASRKCYFHCFPCTFVKGQIYLIFFSHQNNAATY